MTATNRREAFILTTVADLATQANRSGWVALADLRTALGNRGLSRQVQDDTIKNLSRNGQIYVVPEDNRKVLTQADHDAAIQIGGDDCHLISLL